MTVSSVVQHRVTMVSAPPHSPARRTAGVIVDMTYQLLYNRADS